MLGIAALGQLAFAQFPLVISSKLKKRDTHGAGYYQKRHPPVYSEEYYESLRPKLEAPPSFYEDPVLVPVANLRIPLNRLIPVMAVPSLIQLPPYRPMPSLTTAPPEFHMATPEEIAMDDAMIIAALLSED